MHAHIKSTKVNTFVASNRKPASPQDDLQRGAYIPSKEISRANKRLPTSRTFRKLPEKEA
jgi:hypothetical protein